MRRFSVLKAFVSFSVLAGMGVPAASAAVFNNAVITAIATTIATHTTVGTATNLSTITQVGSGPFLSQTALAPLTAILTVVGTQIAGSSNTVTVVQN